SVPSGHRPCRRPRVPPLVAEVPWPVVPGTLPCPWKLRGEVAVTSREVPFRLSQSELTRLQFLCHRCKFASQLVGFSTEARLAGVELPSPADSISVSDAPPATRLFYALPEHGTLASCVSEMNWHARLTVTHGVATALWILHSMGDSYSQLSEESIGVSSAGRAELMGMGLSSLHTGTQHSDQLRDLDQFGHVLDFVLAAHGTDWPQEVAELLRDLASQCRASSAPGLLQNMVTKLAHVLIEYAPAQPELQARQTQRWALLRNLFRACWAFRGSLEALCCVCLEPSEKGKGLLCPRNHKNPLLCLDCLEPYVCSLIGTSELRRQGGGISCPACMVTGEPYVFPQMQVQQKLGGTTLRRFIEATDPQPLEALQEDDDLEAEMQVLVEDMEGRSVRIVSHYRVSEHDEPREAHSVKDVLPFTWLQCGDGEIFFQYDPAQMILRQHLSPRLFAMEVASCLNLECPNPECRALLDPDPDGCVAMSCLACEEGFCWVCFERCGFGGDAHPHVMQIHGDYFPTKPFTQAWHRKHRWRRVHRILRELLEEAQEDALQSSAQLLKDVELWPFPCTEPDPPQREEGAPAPHGDEAYWPAAPAAEAGLHVAARFGQVDVLLQVLEAEDVDVNARNDRGMTALCFAAHEGRAEAIRLLMERAANPNIADDHGVTPLHYACREPPFHIEDDIAGLLLSYENVDANQRDLSGATAIMVAAEVGRAEVIPSLLQCDRVEPNVTNIAGNSALFLAIIFNHLDVVLALLASHRVAVDLRSPNEETVLHLAARRGSREVTQRLLAHPAVDVNALSATGRSALMEAASAGADEVVGCILAKEGIVTDLLDSRGFSSLMLAAQSGSAETFEKLLPVSLSVINARNDEGKTVLMMLAERGAHSESPAHLCLCALLEFAGRHDRITLDINAQCCNGRTALMWAVASGCLASVDCLMALKPDMACQDSRGETAYSLASLWGHRPELFRSLRGRLPLSEPPSSLVLFDGLLLLRVERLNRTLLAAGGGRHFEVPNHTKLTVEFAASTLESWKQAGYALHDAEAFLEGHEICEHELTIQRVNGEPWSSRAGELQTTDFIKLQDRRQVLRFCDWMSAGWTVKTDNNGDTRFCHWGARKIAKVVMCEEDAPEAAEIGDFLLSFS
ncbi:unnamed protein product, partial [Symbiodinium sp. CCMP2456]